MKPGAVYRVLVHIGRPLEDWFDLWETAYPHLARPERRPAEGLYEYKRRLGDKARHTLLTRLAKQVGEREPALPDADELPKPKPALSIHKNLAGEHWLVMRAPSGISAHLNLSPRGGVDDETIVGRTIRELAEKQ